VQGGVQAVYELRDELTRPPGGNDGARTAELAQMIRELLDVPEAGSRLALVRLERW
jgi:hypothetical protein